jgi:dihydroorotate dehydrogenase electron transfer subunit
MAMLAAVHQIAAESYGGEGIPTQLAVEESMACGVGVCMTCVLPVVGDDGRTVMARSCIDGPVFAGDRIRWDALGTVPADAVGAPAAPVPAAAGATAAGTLGGAG